MALMLKKGLVLKQIHNLDRSFEDMMLGLESWIPMYMTGQICPYYFENVQGNVFHHLLKVSGAAALSGEAMKGFHADGRYYLTKSKDELAYYQKRADEMIENALPLMEIYTADKKGEYLSFAENEAKKGGRFKNVLSAPPIYTAPPEFLKSMLGSHRISGKKADEILAFAKGQREIFEKRLEKGCITDEIRRHRLLNRFSAKTVKAIQAIIAQNLKVPTARGFPSSIYRKCFLKETFPTQRMNMPNTLPIRSSLQTAFKITVPIFPTGKSSKIFRYA